MRDEVLFSFIRLVAHTPELQAYTSSRLYTALQADVSQESLTLAAVWVIGEYSEVLLETGIVEEEESKPVRCQHLRLTVLLFLKVRDSDIVGLFENVLESPYINSLIRQFVLASLAKLSSRPHTTQAQKNRIAAVINGFSTSPELEIQQRAVEFASLFGQKDIFEGVLERMPVPEIKATVIGVGRVTSIFPLSLMFMTTYIVSEKKPVGPVRADVNVCTLNIFLGIGI